MGVADGDGERVGRVSTRDLAARQEGADHDLDLFLVRVAGADHVRTLQTDEATVTAAVERLLNRVR